MKTGLEVGKRPSEGRKDKTNNPSERWCWPELEEWWLWESRDSEGQCVLLVFFLILWPHSCHVEVLAIESEPQLRTMPQLQQCWILSNPLPQG